MSTNTVVYSPNLSPVSQVQFREYQIEKSKDSNFLVAYIEFLIVTMFEPAFVLIGFGEIN